MCVTPCGPGFGTGVLCLHHTWSPHARSNLVLKASNNNSSTRRVAHGRLKMWTRFSYVGSWYPIFRLKGNLFPAFQLLSFQSCGSGNVFQPESWGLAKVGQGQTTWATWGLSWLISLSYALAQRTSSFMFLRSSDSKVQLDLRPARLSKGSAPGNWSKPLCRHEK